MQGNGGARGGNRAQRCAAGDAPAAPARAWHSQHHACMHACPRMSVCVCDWLSRWHVKPPQGPEGHWGGSRLTATHTSACCMRVWVLCAVSCVCCRLPLPPCAAAPCPARPPGALRCPAAAQDTPLSAAEQAEGEADCRQAAGAVRSSAAHRRAVRAAVAEQANLCHHDSGSRPAQLSGQGEAAAAAVALATVALGGSAERVTPRVLPVPLRPAVPPAACTARPQLPDQGQLQLRQQCRHQLY